MSTRPRRRTSTPPWKAAQKKSPASSLSLVHAEPAKSARLDSAVPALNHQRSFTDENFMQKQDRDASSSTTQNNQNGPPDEAMGSSKRSKAAINQSTPADLPQQSQIKPKSSGSGQSTHRDTSSGVNVIPSSDASAQRPSSPVRNDISDPLHLVPSASTSIPVDEGSKLQLQPRSSYDQSFWFGSFSKSKGKEKVKYAITTAEVIVTGEIAATDQDGAVNAISEVVRADAPSQLTDSDTQIDATQPEVPPTLQHTPPAQAGTVFSTSPSSEEKPGLFSNLSSVDDEVPRLSTAALPASSPSILQNETTNNITLSSLNPSTSRFTLGIPLLGKSKVPLEQALSTAQRDAIQPNIMTPHAPPSPQVSTPDAVQPAATNDVPPNESSDPVPTTDQTNKPDLLGTASDVNKSSVWQYLGWRTQQTVSHASEQPNDQDPQISASDETLRAADSECESQSTSIPNENALAADVPSANQPNAEGSDDTTAEHVSDSSEVVVPKNKPSSLLSADTSRSQGSAWYAPWAWYHPASSETFPATAPTSENTNAKTESELVRDEVQSREAESVQAPIVQTSPEESIIVRAQEESRNPIESTINSNRSGWLSFFSSKALVMKSITSGEKGGNDQGMEVMDIEDDEDKSHVTSALTVTVTPAGQVEDGSLKSPTTTQPPSSQKQGTDSDQPMAPLTKSQSVKRSVAQRQSSPTPSKKSGVKTPVITSQPNMVLPTWADTFHTPPRSNVPPPPDSALSKTFKFVSGVLFAREGDANKKGKGKALETEMSPYEMALPRARDIFDDKLDRDILKGCTKVAVIGVHGWFPGAVMRTVLGEPTGTSGKFVNMMVQALEEFQEKHNVKLEKITRIPLEGEGTISHRVEKLYNNLIENKEWLDGLRDADAIFVATHSQGSIVSTHLLNRLISDGHIRTSQHVDVVRTAASVASGSLDASPIIRPQRICCLALCGVHLGPLRYLSSSSLVLPYIQYFENTAAKELFDFQNTESRVSREYVKALQRVLDHGIKMVYIASLNDQVVGLYSGLFTSVSHPLILRALYIDGDAYHSSDFLSNLLVLLLRIRNAGLSDSSLLTHLSEATAGSLNGIGHSTPYEEIATYALAVDYLFLTDDGLGPQTELQSELFNAMAEQNDYEIPWSLRDLIADHKVAHFFSQEFLQLRDVFRDWHPKTTILRDIKRKLQPIQRLSPAIISNAPNTTVSKL